MAKQWNNFFSLVWLLTLGRSLMSTSQIVLNCFVFNEFGQYLNLKLDIRKWKKPILIKSF
jgi:hypothetical protein